MIVQINKIKNCNWFKLVCPVFWGCVCHQYTCSQLLHATDFCPCESVRLFVSEEVSDHTGQCWRVRLFVRVGISDYINYENRSSVRKWNRPKISLSENLHQDSHNSVPPFQNFQHSAEISDVFAGHIKMSEILKKGVRQFLSENLTSENVRN